MAYEYVFYAPGQTENHITTLHTVEPLPGIIKGHCLLLNTHQKDVMFVGMHLEITDVVTYINCPTDAPERIRTEVYTRSRKNEALRDGVRSAEHPTN